MAFVALCSFCRLILRGVPDDRLGSSVECPRCRNSFTLAPVANPEAVMARVRRVLPHPPPPAAPATAVEEPVSPPRTAVAEATAAKSVPADEQLQDDPPVLAPPVAEEVPEATPHPVPVPGFPNYPGLASFLLGCSAFLAGGVLHAGLATLALGLVGLLLGIIGLIFSSLTRTRRALPAAGLAVSLPALLLPVLVPSWLGLNPLSDPPRPTNRAGEAVISLSNRGGLRRATEGETLWADASRDALHHGDVRLRVSSARVGPADFMPVPGQEPPLDRCLLIGLRLTNAGVTRKMSYAGWDGGDPAQGQPVLRDNQGKTYAAKTFGPGWVVKGRARDATIPPGKFLDDVLAFEAPPGTIDYLRLELPAAAVGAEGKLQMEIPKHMIAFR